MNRTELLNRLIDQHGYCSYLEIGVHNNSHNFDYIRTYAKVGVDPDPKAKPTHVMTSDEFFDHNKSLFDLIFIDGLHQHDQVYKDVLNALDCLTPDGTIVCHDCLPLTFEAQDPEAWNEKGVPGFIWNGDCWRAIVRLRQEHPEICMLIMNSDHGLGVIRKGEQEVMSTKRFPKWDEMEFMYYKSNVDKMIDVLGEG